MQLLSLTAICPEKWLDRSMVVFQSPKVPASGIVPNVVVTRAEHVVPTPKDAAERVRKFVDTRVAEMEKNLPGVTIHSRRPSRNTDYPAEEVYVSWRSDENVIGQGVTFIDVDSRHVLVVTATALKAEYFEFQDEFVGVVSRIRPDRV